MRRTSCLAFFLLTGAAGLTQTIHGRDGITLPEPPEVQKTPVVDDYFGTKITDNYRWLEDAKSTETRAFIDAQNAYTARYLKQVRIRNQALDDLDALENVSASDSPIERAGSYFFRKRLAGEQQFSIYVRHGWAEAAAKRDSNAQPSDLGKDERLIDPAKLSRDPNTSVGIEDVSRDGSLVAYWQRQGGADEATIHVLNVKTGKTLEDELPAARYSSVDFTPDAGSLYYARNDKQGTLLYQHVLGTRNSQDTLIFGHEFRGETLGGNDLFSGRITDDGHYLVVEISRGVPAKREDIVFRDLTKPDSPFDVLVWGLDSRFHAIYAKGAWYVRTDYKSPKGRILKADPGILPDVWKTIVPEGQDVIEDWSIVGGKVYVNRLKDVKTETSVYTLEGKPAGTIGYDTIGSASGVAGRTTDRYGFFSFSSYIVPPTIYRLDTVTGKREVFFQSKVHFDSSQYVLKQVFFQSKDGTRIPMFIAGQKGLKQDGTERLLMTGYGGFNLSMTPNWNPAWAWWLEQGGWFAMPNLRGGGEYGETLARAGHVREKTERLRRLVCSRRVPDRQQVHFAAALRHHRPVERRPVDGRVYHAETRPICRRLVRLSAAGYAALSEVHSGLLLDYRIRHGGERKAIRLPAEILALSEREGRHRLSRGDVLHWRQRYARRPAARAQDDRSAAVGKHQRPAHPAALQPGRRPLRRGQRRPAGAGRCRPAFVPVDGNRTACRTPRPTLRPERNGIPRPENPEAAGWQREIPAKPKETRL